MDRKSKDFSAVDFRAADFRAVDELSNRRLPAEFYQREPHALAEDLLGRDIVRELDDGSVLRGRIVELEVYGHVIDRASHCYSGVPSTRTAPMFGVPGTAYVYLIYGMYHCMNIVAPSAERPSALLVRALEPIEGLGQMAENRGLVKDEQLAQKYAEKMPASVQKKLMSGPGKLCQAMQIDLSFNTHPFSESPLYICEGAPRSLRRRMEVATGPRIGLNLKTVGECYHWPWRYGVAGSDYLSRDLPPG